MDWNENALCLGFARNSGVSEMREPQFSIRSKTTVFMWSYLRGQSDPETVLSIYCIVLHYFCESEYRITEFAAKEMDSHLLFQNGQTRDCEIRSAPTPIFFFPLKCVMQKHVLHTKWKSICHLRLSYSSSPSSPSAILVQQPLLQVWCSPECKCHFLFFLFWERRALNSEKIRTG